MAENLMKVPAKGILKNSTSFEGSTTNKGQVFPWSILLFTVSNAFFFFCCVGCILFMIKIS